MWTFQYKHGDRPLDGFTIQRAAGRGGFGEVYYAVSDSGREVALKAVTGYEQIEVRGISQCMNLKSPHLVTIFDVKYNDQGKPFVIMEFVSGPSLRQLLDESPAGLGTQKAAFFLREIGKGLTFLHDCGIVHRDLKPGNIFFENGYVKIGDYGLSKAISPTQHSGQTVTVGTVHYMAPEVGAGRYDRSIDIYAMGAVLYEMLTGTVPFIGASPSEILIKHLQSDPDCAGIPEPFCTVIKKAMAKDPAQRYANVQEMVEAVFGAAHVQMSVSHFSPDDLSMVAGRVAQKIGIGSPGSGAPGSAPIGTSPLGNNSGSSSVIGAATVNSANPNRFANNPGIGGWQGAINRSFDQLRDRMDQFARNNAIATQPRSNNGINDPLSSFTRAMLAFLTAVVVAIAAGTLIDSSATHNMQAVELSVLVFNAVCGATVGLIIGWRYIAIPKLSTESHTVRKLVVGSVTGGAMLLLVSFFFNSLIHFRLGGDLIAILAPLFFFNTWEWVRANRAERISLSPPIEVGIAAFVLTLFFGGSWMLAAVVLAGISLAAQVAAPWDPILAKRRSDNLRSKVPGADKDEREAAIFGNVTTDPAGAEAMQRNGTQIFGNLHVQSPGAPPPVWQKPVKPTFPVWQHARMIWFLGAVLAFSIGLTAIIVGAASPHADQQSLLVAFGICGMINALICFVRSFSKTYSTIWIYLIRPILMMLCVLLIVMFATNVADERTPDGVSVFLIIISSIGIISLPFVRFDKKVSTTASVKPPPILNPNAVNAPAPSIIPSIPPLPPLPQMPLLRPLRGRARAWNNSMRNYRRWNRRNRALQIQNGKTFCSIMTGLLILISVALTLAIGLDLPLAVAKNLPNYDIAHNIRVNLLGDFPTWQILITKLLVMVDFLTIIAAITFSLIARSGKNLLHLLRACVGIIGLILAVAFAAEKFHGEQVWPLVAQSLDKHNYHPEAAIDTISSGFQNPATVVAILLFILSIFILSIPPRDKSKDATKGAA